MEKSIAQKYGRGSGIGPLDPASPRAANGNEPQKDASHEQTHLGYRYTLPTNLEYISDRGVIINHDAESHDRQLVLRVDTFNKMIDSIYSYVERHVSTEPENSALLADFVDGILHSCGLHCGESFGDRIFPQLLKGQALDVSDLVDKWVQFDSQVGFGKLTQLKIVEETMDSSCLEGSLLFRENFMGLYKVRTEHQRCIFIRGYCEGVLKSLARNHGYIGYKFRITCDTKICQRRGKRGQGKFDKCCVFKVEGSPDFQIESPKWILSKL